MNKVKIKQKVILTVGAIIAILAFFSWTALSSYYNKSVTLLERKKQSEKKRIEKGNQVLINKDEKLLQMKPKTAEDFKKRGNVYFGKKNFDQAISDYSKAIELNPNFAPAYYNRGLAYCAKGNYDQAISDYSKAIELKPNYADAYLNRGVAYSHKGNPDQAISDYSKAIELKPDDFEAYEDRGSAYCDKGDFDQAISDCNKAIEINPNSATAYFYRSGVYLYKKQNDMAYKDMMKAKDLGLKEEGLQNLLDDLKKSIAIPDLEVSGIVYVKNGRSYAIVNGEVAKVGDKISGVDVVEIAADYVKFKYGGEVIVRQINSLKVKPDKKAVVQEEKRKEIAKIGIYANQMARLMEEFGEALNVANSTDRASLDVPLARLQEIKRTAEAINVPESLKTCHPHFLNTMDLNITAVLNFMRQEEYLSEGLAEKAYNEAFQGMDCLRRWKVAQGN